jgi:hypothetical protein
VLNFYLIVSFIKPEAASFNKPEAAARLAQRKKLGSIPKVGQLIL